MTRRTIADRGVRQQFGLGLGQRHQFGHAIDWQLRISSQNLRQRSDQAHRLEVLHGVETELGKYRRVDSVRAQREQHGVAIGRSARCDFGSDRTAGAALVVDQDGLAEHRLKTLLNDTCDYVGSAARRIGNQKADRLVGIGARLRPRESRRRNSHPGQRKHQQRACAPRTRRLDGQNSCEQLHGGLH